MNNEYKNQCNEILSYMEAHGGITAMDAYRLGISRLSGRIYDLRRHGVDIVSVDTMGKNRHGRLVRFTTYRLSTENE